MDDAALRQLLTTMLQYSSEEEEWVEPWRLVLTGLTAEQAAWRPGAEMKGVWDIVLHVTVWNENLLERARTGEALQPAEGSWPTLPGHPTEEAWSATKVRFWASLDALGVYVRTTPLEQMSAAPYGLGDLVCRFIHLAYHAGQVEKLRQVKGW